MPEVELLDRVAAPEPIDLEARRDAYWRFLEKLHLGLVQFHEGTLYGLGLPLIRMGRPHFEAQRWTWPIRGGLLAAEPGGEVGFGAEDGHLVGFLHGYHPALPDPVYRLTQAPFHHLVTRLFLLQLRGRRRPPGVPAEPALRVGAAALDLAAVLALSRLLPRRRRAAWAAGAGAAYLVAGWTAGATPGMRALKLKLESVDGSRVTAGQAALRLVLAPVAALLRRAVHDETAGTEVISTR